MVDFVDGIQLAIHPTVATLPAHQKGVMVWSDEHGGLVISDGARWINPLQPSYPFPVVAGGFVDCVPFTAVSSSASVTQDGFRLAAFVPRIDFDCDQLSINVVSASAGTNCKLVIYAADGVDGWLPGTLLFNSGNISTTTTGNKTAAISPVFSFKSGKLYWIGSHYSSSSVAIAIMGSSDGQAYNLGAYGGAVITYMTGIYKIISFASGPPSPGNSEFGAAERISMNMPRVKMRIA